MKRKIKEFSLYGSYYYSDIQDFAASNNSRLQELGQGMGIGESFLVMHSPKADVTSFVMDGYNNTYGASYKCVYSDLPLRSNLISTTNF